MATFGSAHSPPSEKESGVTFSTAWIRVRRELGSERPSGNNTSGGPLRQAAVATVAGQGKIAQVIGAVVDVQRLGADQAVLVHGGEQR